MDDHPESTHATALGIFAAELKGWRARRGLSQRVLASRAYVSEATIAKVETGRRWPSRDLATECDKVLDTDGALCRLWPLVEADHHAHNGRRRPQPSTDPTQDPPASHTGTDSGPARDDALASRERALQAALHEAVITSRPNPGGVLTLADEVRHLVEEVLEDSTSAASRLQRLEAAADQHARDALTVAPVEMVCRLSLDLLDAHHLARTRRGRPEARRIHALLARLAVLTADEMTVLGDVHTAHRWYRTASAAADAAGDPALHADVLALTAMQPPYHGNPTDAADLARRARALAGDTRYLAAGLTPMLEGPARAKAGHLQAARETPTAATRADDRAGGQAHTESVFGFSPQRQLFYQGRLHTMLGDYAAAARAQAQALDLYPPDVVGDPTLIHLDRAAALVGTGHPDDGAALVTATLPDLSAAHRTRLFAATGPHGHRRHRRAGQHHSGRTGLPGPARRPHHPGTRPTRALVPVPDG